jgi:hypothetical protein
MATRAQTAEWKQVGQAQRQAREQRELLGNRPGEELRRLREQAHQCAAVCADCLQPLAPTVSITLTERFVEHVPTQYKQFCAPLPAHDRWLLVPICLPCWLVDLDPVFPVRGRGMRERGEDRAYFWSDQEVRRHRCAGCGRAMRIVLRRWKPAPLWARCCCADCLHQVQLKRANVRRRVRNAPIKCSVCRKRFVPTKSTAKTCSNKCRQALFRRTHRKRRGARRA